MKVLVAALLENEPVTLADAKLHLRTVTGDTSEDAGIITPLIEAAREYCENITGTAIRKQRIKGYPQEPGTEIRLFRVPLWNNGYTIDVEAINLYWADGTSTVLEKTSYAVDVVDGTIVLTEPLPKGTPRAVNPMEIIYVAGYQTAPKPIRQAMLLLIAHWYENREAVVVGSAASVDVGITVEALLRQYKAWWY